MLLERQKTESENYYLFDSLVVIKGEDAFSFLQSQTTNDLNKLAIGEFQFNSLLDLTGKVVSAFILCRVCQNHFYLLVDSINMATTIERLEKFHISEDFTIEQIRRISLLQTHSKYLEKINDEKHSEVFEGKYYFEQDRIIFTENLDQYDIVDSLLLDIMCGIQKVCEDELSKMVINNTRFEELAVDYKKGCFLGQETVAKIHFNRGASYKPVLIILETEIHLEKKSILTVEGRKIGILHRSITWGGKTYACTSLIRDKRVDKSNIYFEINSVGMNGVVHYYPFLKTTNKEIAIDLYDHAIELFHRGEEILAIEYFEKSISLYPEFEDAYESLGVLHGRREQYDIAISLMEKLKKINPKCMMALTNLSLFHMKMGNIEIAEKYKADATFLNFEILGDEASKKREIENAKAKKVAEQQRRESMFLQVLEMDSADAMANNGMGEIELERGEYTKAIGHFKAAILEDPKYSVAYLGLAKSLRQKGDFLQAKDVLDKGIKVAGKNGDLMPANEMQSLLLTL